jgi:glutamyl-Q tRNA(Asp) synthetase
MENSSEHVCGRFAPSPSGGLHLGSLVAALASFLSAKSQKGQWLVRMDDIDKAREPAGAAHLILHQLAALGLTSEQPVIWQSTRLGRYRDVLNQLIDLDLAFPCFCSRTDLTGRLHQGRCQKLDRDRRGGQPSWRLLARDLTITVHDERLGLIQQNMLHEVGDIVLWRADDWPSYQLANGVDDADLGITEIVRGADLWESTPRQVYLQQLMQWHTPKYLHVPLVMSGDGQKLSKQNLAAELLPQHAVKDLKLALQFLRQTPSEANQVDSLLRQAQARFNRQMLCREPS